MLSIRIATDDDLAAVGTIDPSYATALVWQMYHHAEGEEILTRFRVVRLPHSRRLDVAMRPAPEATAADLFLVAYDDSEPVGYLKAVMEAWRQIAWLDQVAVREPRRRRGVGAALVSEAKGWGKGQGLSALMAGVKTLNYPATHFLQRCGFVFCGYNDRSYPGPDIVLFFCCELR